MAQVPGSANENRTNVTPPSSKINVAQLIAKVNPGFSDFYKYIPSELLTEAQISSKTVALDDEKYRLGVLRGEDVLGMLRKKAEKAGYSPDDSWKMDHRAPNADDDTAHNMAEIDAAYGGDGSIYSAQAAYYYGEGRSYDRNAIRVIQSARNNPDKQITVYRAVPADLKETRLRNGDWVAIVKQYAIEHGNRVLDGNFKIIEMTVPAKYLYGNGDSINEWGYDNGNRNEVYKNTANNVKTLEVTYDNSGELIPLSKRYDERKKDIRFQRKLPDVQSIENKAKNTEEYLKQLRAIGRKSVNNFTSEDIRQAEQFAQRYYKEMGVKSPFFRAWFGDWRAYDKTPITVAIEQGDARGTKINNDTGWSIQVSGKIFNETKSHNREQNIYAQAYLPYINSIVENAVLFDSSIIPSEKAKSINSAFMHTFFALADSGNGPEILKLYVEELNDANSDGTIKRAYQLQNIEKQQLSVKGSGNTPLASSASAADIHTVADLFEVVKSKNKGFQPKPVNSLFLNADGTPKVFYHGAKKNGGFTVFKDWQYFTDKKS